ncbi:mycocerosic acid synthase-like [Rana temporaria]|uniref:mycocerosic acid synthase-like n=1 Tax=Rana temporaria TaxID=8407 RepID=UPI001AAD4499|nr:mycocerosic acid synthase-like [Rana temporaria]
MDYPEDAIAIVGIGCNFPGGEGIDNFWKVIAEGRNCTVEIPEERFITKHWYDSDYNKPGKICTNRAAIVNGIHMFDNKLFGIHNAESDHMDPQHKLLLQCTYRALEDAGYAMESISGSNTGVYIGLMNKDAEFIYNNYPENINHFNGTGTSMCIAANRISYQFNLTGPSLSLDTACSSSLVALHLACQAIRQGDCEMAICGGVSCIIDPHIYVALSKAKMISPEGTSKPFSKKADGYGRGEGCGIVILKPLKQAKEDYSKIWGVICACSVNQDGRSVTPITKPSQDQQEKLLKRIYTAIDPCSLQYVEAHGTGTPVGDPIEVTSIGNIIGKKRPSGMKPLKIGSVKGNIGHTESAAGMAGLIKVLLMMHHEVIPPSLHYSKELGIKQIEESKLVVPTVPENWHEDVKFGRMAGINCFGFGGTNSHVIIKQYKEKNSKHHSKRPSEIFVFSACSSKSLQLIIEDTKQELSKMPSSLSLENLVYTAACRRSHVNFKYRAAFLASSLPNLQQQLQSVNTETAPATKSPQIVFVFCGNGVLSKGMCKVLLENEEVFKAKCLEVDKMIQVYTSLSVVQLLENEYDDFSSPDVAQLLLFTIQVSLVDLLRHWGVNPDCVLGHSVGEVAAAYCSGLLSLEDAVKVIYHRSKLQCKVTGGKMLVVGNVPVKEISNIVLSSNGKACIAAYNSPSSCTVSGDGEAIQQISDHLSQHYKKRNIFLHDLDVPAAYHSHLMDPILDDIKYILSNLHTNNLKCELISTATGKPATKGDFTTGEYWAKNIRDPVEFEQAIKASANNKEHIAFIEIGPRRALQKNIVDIVGSKTFVMPAAHPKNEHETLFSLLSALFKKGYNPNWNNVFSEYKSSPSYIPRYQFEHNKQDIRFDEIRQGNQSAGSLIHPLVHSVSADFTKFKCTLSKSLTPYVYEHKNLGSTLVPGAFFVELALAATVISLKPRVPLHSLEISATFLNPCILQKESQELNVKIHQQDQVIHYEILTSHVYATGHVQKLNIRTDGDKRIYIRHIVKRCQTVFKKEDIHELLSNFGFEYGKIYKQLCDVHYGEELNEGIAKIKIGEVKETMYEYHIHPVILDCFLQMVVCVVGSRIKEAAAIFPSSIGSLTIFQPLQEEMVIYIKTIKITESYTEVCGCFADTNGLVLVEIKNARMALMKQAARTQNNNFFQINWTKIPSLKSESNEKPSMLVYADNSGVSQQLSAYIHEGVNYINFTSWDSDIQLHKLLSSECKDVVFMWGIHRLSDTIPNNSTQYLAKCCEVYRNLILAVRQKGSEASIKTVTFRTTENTVDHINPGFVFVGMTRACITEVTNITFQLIDIGSSSPQDVAVLAQVLLHYKPNDHPEIRIKEGCIYTGEIIHTDIENSRQLSAPLEKSDNFTLCTSDIHTIADLSAEPNNSSLNKLAGKDVEIRIDKIGAHTEDYFPVSLFSWQYGNTLYWNGMVSDKHKLIALDLAGTVTAIGRDVQKIQIGDRVASCYPTVANSKVRIPERVCCLIKKFPMLRDTPFVSLFVLAWEILHKRLPRAKNKPRLTIVTPEEKSVLSTLLSKAAKQSGWETTISPGITANGKQCSAMVILPTSEIISGEDIAHLSILKDVVIICDHKNSTYFQSLASSCRQNIHIHILDLAIVFQRAYLQESAKDIYKWLRSLFSDVHLILPKSIMQASNSTSNLNNTVSSYFKAQSLPLIELDNNTIRKIPMSMSGAVLFKHNAVYIVAGGLTGLGFETVKFILHNGGDHIVILSRRNPNTEMEQQIAKARSENENTKIITLQCNISLYADVKKAIDSIQKIFTKIPVKGVFHSAVVLHDSILEMLNLSLFEKVLGPKVDGVVNLHLATLNQKLDYFVCYSSIASFAGNSAQANYAAANSFLDIFCQYRRNLGLPAQSINWGALNTGLLLDRTQVHNILQAKGLLLITVPEMHEYLKRSLLIDNCQQAIVKFDFKLMYDNLASRIPVMKRRFISLVMEHVINSDDKNQIKQSKVNKQKSEDYVLSLVSELTSVTISDITMNSLLNSLGIDSMLAMTLQNRIFEEKEVNVPVVKLLDPNTTILEVASLIKQNSPDEEKLVENVIFETQL